MSTRRRSGRDAPRLVVGLLALLVGGACTSPPAPPAPDRLLLVTIDTLRADHVGCYGYGSPTTGNLDALAARSYLYENAYAHTPWTPPSHASLLTGLLPPEHGLRDLWHGTLAPSAVPLAEVLAERGYATAAFVSAVPLRRALGLDRGFDVYDDADFSGEKPNAQRSAAATNARALAWLREHAGRSFFLWVHYFEPHQPYVANPEYEAAAAKRQIAVPRGEDPVAVRDRSVFRYDGEIFAADEALGALLDALEEFGVADRTAIVVTSDHGEYLGEHELLGHQGVYEEVLRVPLVLHDPSAATAPARFARPVRHVDLFPTLLGMLGVRDAPVTPNAKALPPFGDENARDVYAEHAVSDAPSFALRRQNWKVAAWMWPDAGAAPGRLELFNLARDPREARNLSQSESARASSLLADLGLYRRLTPQTPASGQVPPEAVAEKLRSLGYAE